MQPFFTSTGCTFWAKKRNSGSSVRWLRGSVLSRPAEDRLVTGVVDGREERPALVVAAALRSRERASDDLALLGGSGQVVDGREVVPAHLLRCMAARQVERVDEGAMAVARSACRLEQRSHELLEGRKVVAVRIRRGIEARNAGHDRRARRLGDDDRRHASVVLGRAVLDPAPEGAIRARRGIEDRAAGVLDVGHDVDLRAVPELDRNLVRGHVLHQHRRLPVRPVVEKEVSPSVHSDVVLEGEVTERVALRVRDVAARAGVRAHAGGLEDRRDRAVEVRRRLRLLRRRSRWRGRRGRRGGATRKRGPRRAWGNGRPTKRRRG